jgi:hypothetical protein
MAGRAQEMRQPGRAVIDLFAATGLGQATRDYTDVELRGILVNVGIKTESPAGIATGRQHLVVRSGIITTDGPSWSHGPTLPTSMKRAT